MPALAEYFESGNAPHEALGRAARRLASGGALYLGAGVGVEKQQTPKGEVFHVTNATGKPETFSGPLSAVIRAFAKAGSSTGIDSPGGATVVADPAAAARLRELADEEAEARRDIDRYVARLKRRQAQAARGIGIGYSPMRADDDQWEARRIEELKSDLGRIAAERSKLLASGKVEEVEQARPGTNFTKIPPKNVAKLKGIIDHYRGMAHPFSTCVRDQVKHGLSEDHANRRCAVVKDLATGTTKWRKGGKGKVAEELERSIVEALERVEVVEQTLGTGMAYALAEGVPGAPAAMVELGEALGNDFALLALSGHPLAEMLFESFSEHMHPRDLLGQFRKKVGGLKPGESASLPDGHKVTRVERTAGRAGKFSQYLVSKPTDKPGTSSGVAPKDPAAAAKAAADLSARSTHARSLGGAQSFRDAEDAAANGDLPAGTYIRPKDEKTRGVVRSVDRGVHKVELEGDSDALHRYSRRELEELPKAGASVMKPGATMQQEPAGVGAAARPVEVVRVLPDGKVEVRGMQGSLRGKVYSVPPEKLREPGGWVGRQLPTKKRATLGSAQGAARRAEVEQIKGRPDVRSMDAKVIRRRADIEADIRRAQAIIDLGLRSGMGERHGNVRDNRKRIRELQAELAGLREAAGSVLDALLDGPLREAFGSGTGSGTPSASRDARRNVKRQQGTAARSSGSGSFDESKHKRGAAGSSQGGKFVAMGGSGDDVRAVQAKVGAKTDGSFGAKTKQAVMDFQRKHGLKVDGIVGHQTAVALAGNYKAAKTAKVGGLKDSDRSKLKGLRSTRRRGRAPERSRGGTRV